MNRPPVQARWTTEDAALRVVFEGLGRELRCVRAPQLRIRLSMMQHAHRHEVVHLVASAQPRRHNVVHAIGSVLAGEIYGVVKSQRSHDPREYARRLAKLTAETWLRGDQE